MKLSEEKALHKIAAYCSRAERCEFDIRRKLTSWELSDIEQNSIINRLKNEKFLDHNRYCRSFINDKVKYNKWGVNKIIFELRKKQIEEKFYLPILEEVSRDTFEEQLVHLLKVKNKSVKAKDFYDRKNKLIRFSLGRGFSMDLTVRSVENLLNGKYDDED